MEKEKKCNCDETCTCGCQEGKECTCDENGTGRWQRMYLWRL